MSHLDAFHDDGPPIYRLQAAVCSLEKYVHAILPPPTTSALPTASPAAVAPNSAAAPQQPPSLSPVEQFSRLELTAGKWKVIGRSHVAVCGLGGVGATAADALVRAGVGGVLLVDHERIRWSCMGQAGFHPDEVGFSRTQALRLRLQSICAAASPAAFAAVDSFSIDWQSETDLAQLRKKLKASSVGDSTARMRPPSAIRSGEAVVSGEGEEASSDRGGSTLGLFEALTQRRPYDVVISTLEDDSDRLVLNQLCLELSLPLLHAALTPCNTRISIRTVLPGYTCCLECIDLNGAGSTYAESTQVSASPGSSMDQVAKSIAKGFPASLPHVELMAGGLLGQHALKFLLEIGDFVPFYTINALTFEMESFSFPPNRVCSNLTCRQRQEDEQTNATARY